MSENAMTTEQRLEAELAEGIPDGWTYRVGGTPNTITVTAERPNKAGTYKVQTARHNPLPDVREFIRMCQLFANRP